MKKSVEVIGLSVISITEGLELGTVKDLLINPAEGKVGALVIADEKWYRGAKFLPFSSITGLGEYAVTVENSNDLFVLSAVPEFEQLLDANVRVIGTKVLTRTGQIQGKVVEIVIDDAGKIAECEVEEVGGDRTSMSTNRVITFGKDVLIIAGPEEVVPIIETPVAVQQPEAVAPVTATPAPKAEPAPAVAAKPPVQPEPKAAATSVPPVVTPDIPVTAGAELDAPTTKTENADDAANKRFDDKHRKYLLGKKASRRIETDNGMIIVDEGGEITEEVLQKAKLAGKFVELSMNIQ